jgi:hypothetical protein
MPNIRDKRGIVNAVNKSWENCEGTEQFSF